MVIAIIGAGNIGTLMAGEFAARGHEVRLYSSKAADWSQTIEVYGQQDELVCVGALACVTDDLAEAVQGVDYVWVTYPTSQFAGLAAKLNPLIVAGQKLAVVPGADAEFAFGEVVGRGATLLGLQRVHSVARIKERGRSVYQLGRRTSGLHLASIPAAAAADCAGEVEALFDLPVEVLPNYLVETLTPSNPILHTTRICTMFADWQPGVTYPENILFYERWTQASSELLIACDEELQQVCRVLERACGLDLAGVRSLKLHYESPTAEAMTAKISSIPAFKGLTSPMREEAPGQWVPDFSSRYFKADFAYGLKVIRDIAALVGVSTPNIEHVWQWYLRTSGETECFEGVPTTVEELAALYA